MKIGRHRRSLMVWSPSGGPADRWCPDRHPARTAQADPMVVPYRRAARGHRYHAPRTHHAAAGSVFLVIGAPLADRWCRPCCPSGAAFVSGLLALLVALLRGAEPARCPGCEPDDRNALARLRANDLQ